MKTLLFLLSIMFLSFTSCVDLLLNDYSGGSSSGYRCPSTTNSNNNETCELDYSGPGEMIWSRMNANSTTYGITIFLHQKDGIMYLAEKDERSNVTTNIVAVDIETEIEIYSVRLNEHVVDEISISDKIYFEENIFWVVGSEYLEKYDLNSGQILSKVLYAKKFKEIFKVGNKFIGAEIVFCEAVNFIKLYELNMGLGPTTLIATMPLGQHTTGHIWYAGLSQLNRNEAFFVVQEKGSGIKSHKLFSVDFGKNLLSWSTEVPLDLHTSGQDLFNLSGQSLAVITGNEIVVLDLNKRGALNYTIPFPDIKYNSRIFSVGSDFLFVNGKESGVRFQKESGIEIFRTEEEASKYFRSTTYQLKGETLFISNVVDGFISFDVNTLQEIEMIPGPHSHCWNNSVNGFRGNFQVSIDDYLIIRDRFGCYRIDLE